MTPVSRLRDRLPELESWLRRRIPLDLSVLLLDHLRMTAADVAPWPQAGANARGHIQPSPTATKPPQRPARALHEALRDALDAGELPAHPALRDAIAYLDSIAESGEGRAAAARRNRIDDLERMRTGTRRAIGLAGLPGYPLHVRVSVVQKRIRIAGLAAYGLPRMPGRRLIVAELRRCDALCNQTGASSRDSMTGTFATT